MAKLSFLGATGTVTGSRFLLEVQGKKLLIDCGLFQGLKKNRLRNWEPFPVSPDEVDRVFLTHAHIDHSGYLPRFCSQGFNGRIHCTHATRDLCEILLRDSAHLQEEDAYWANKKGFSKHKPALPLYTTENAEKALSLFEPSYYGEDIHITDEARLLSPDTERSDSDGTATALDGKDAGLPAVAEDVPPGPQPDGQHEGRAPAQGPSALRPPGGNSVERFLCYRDFRSQGHGCSRLIWVLYRSLRRFAEAGRTSPQSRSRGCLVRAASASASSTLIFARLSLGENTGRARPCTPSEKCSTIS